MASTQAEPMERKRIGWPKVIWRHLLWVPLIPLVISVAFGLIAWHQAGHARLLENHGVDGVAVVTNRDIRVRRDSNNGERRDFRLFYTFDAGLGEIVSSYRAVNAARYHATAIGDEIPVRYVSFRPDIHEIEEGTSQLISVVFGLVSVVTGLGALGSGAWVWRRKASLIRAARSGPVCEARVEGHVPSNVTVNNRRLMQARWLDAMGATGQTAPARDDRLPAVGSVIVVYVDPKSGRGWWEGDF